MILAASWPSNVDAQTVVIRSTGGFLGYLDGFPEFPGWPGDTFEGNPDLIANPSPPPDPSRPVPYGGLIGVATYLKSHVISTGQQVLLISGNNHPQQIAALRDHALRNNSQAIPAAGSHWFWKPLIDMKPQAVGVGAEDINRWLAQMRPEHLMTWIKDGISAGLPFVASNVIVHLADKNLNVVRNEEHGVTIDVAEGESLGMLDSLTLKHPCAINTGLRSSRFTFDAGPAVTVDTLTPAEVRAESESASSKARRAVLGSVCHTTIEFAQRLRPGKSYLLASSFLGPAFRFRLTTHGVLTPHAAWDGLPVVGATPAGLPMAIMGFVSPAAAKELPPEYFDWTKEQGCRAANCRIEFVAADKAARSLVDAMAPVKGQPPPIVVAISDLDESETTALLDAVPEIRFIALQPDTGRLGRAAPVVVPSGPEERPYSGDLSFGAVVDAVHPELTRLMVRPTWLGEIVHTASANFTRSARGTWQATNTSLQVEPVPGASLGWESAGNGVRYTASLDPKRFRISPAPVEAEPALFRPYCPIDVNGPFDAISREQQGDLWTNPASFAGLVLDDMRRSLRADIAIVPDLWIDRDVIAAIQTPPATGAPALSGFMLQRILYRSKRVVRVAVEGSQLRDLLKRIIAAADDPVCVSGLGLANSCPLNDIDVDDLLVNVRKPEDGNYYRLVVPASVARAEDLSFTASGTRDLLVDLDARLAACTISAPQALKAGEGPVAERLESRLAARWQHYMKFDPLTFEYASTGVTEPAGNEGVFSRLPVTRPASGPAAGSPSRAMCTRCCGIRRAICWECRCNSGTARPGSTRKRRTTTTNTPSGSASIGSGSLSGGRSYSLACFWTAGCSIELRTLGRFGSSAQSRIL